MTVTDMQNHTASPCPIEKGPLRKIHSVLECYRNVKPEAYTPVVVSFGPYHNGSHDLFQMEKHKVRVLRMFLELAPLETSSLLERAVQAEEPRLRQCYLVSRNNGSRYCMRDDDGFSKFMVREGLFLIVLLDVWARTAHFDGCVWENMGADHYPPLLSGEGLPFSAGDPVFGYKARQYLWPYIRRDMLLVENQIPLAVLEVLLKVPLGCWAPIQGDTIGQLLRLLILLFFELPLRNSGGAPFSMPVGGHILDVYRNSFLIQDGQQDHTVNLPNNHNIIVDRAKDLWLSGVAVKQGIQPTGRRFQIHVEKRCSGKIIHIPELDLDDITESVLLNLLALERLDEGIDDQVTTFVQSMIGLVRTPSDCRILRLGYNVSLSSVWTDEAVSSFFQKVAKTLYPQLQQHLNASRRKSKSPLCFRVMKNIFKYLFVLFIEDNGRALTFVGVLLALFGIWFNVYINFGVKRRITIINGPYNNTLSG